MINPPRWWDRAAGSATATSLPVNAALSTNKRRSSRNKPSNPHDIQVNDNWTKDFLIICF